MKEIRFASAKFLMQQDDGTWSEIDSLGPHDFTDTGLSHAHITVPLYRDGPPPAGNRKTRRAAAADRRKVRR